MKRTMCGLRICLLLLLLAPLFWTGSAMAQGRLIVCQSVNGVAPTIDGVVGAGEWPAPPNRHLQPPDYPIETNFTCVYDAQNLYVLVDAVGDITDGNFDECLLVFDLPPDHKIVEIWKDGGLVTRFTGGAAGDSSMGLDGHRVYEFGISLASIGLRPGGSIPFYSPVQYKTPGIWASMPFDSDDGRDNVFPDGLVVQSVWDPNSSTAVITSVTGYDRLSLGMPPVGAPSLNAWGMIGLVLMLGAMGCLALQRRWSDSR